MDEQPAPSETPPESVTQTAVYKVIPHPDMQALPVHIHRILVEVIGGPMDGQRHAVTTTTLTIGRNDQNDFALPLDTMVSSQHARIVREGEHFWLEDLDSRNGTLFGDERIDKRVLLAPGSMFIVGRTCLEFMPR